MNFRELISNKPQSPIPNIKGWFDFANIYDFAVDHFPNGSTFVEVGCWEGKSTAYMASRIKESKKQIHFICVDIWKTYCGEWSNIFPIFKNNLQSLSLFDSIVPIQGESTVVAGMFPPQHIDFIFLDAGHDYDSVKNDIIYWLPKIKPNGIMAGHDFTPKWNGVVKAVQEQFETFEVINSSWITQISHNNSSLKLL
ncbi:MAG: class I SAM-dependent methyltransferase [Crenarchaeota archaeon]|nr:MAG: class I SAM-dependent methyltransferase [Thermoproteota archaeon]